ncbi:MAG: flippase-like domain-containing protein [Bacteroidales bacterium]|nr:flippase-like domain-containing protein [Bacteroidales bacterium]
MNKKVGNILKYSLSILLAAVLLFFAFKDVDWAEFWAALKACRWEYVILSMLFGALAFYCRALRWRQLLLPIDSSTSRLTCFNAVNISYLVNMALPRVGEVARCGYITAHSKKVPDVEDGQPRRPASFDKVLGTAALERTADIIMMLLTLSVFLLFTWKRFGGFFSEKIFGAASGSITVKKVSLVAALVVAAAVMVWVTVRYADSWKPLRKIKDFCIGLWQGFISCLKMEKAWRFFALTVAVWACYWMMSATILWAVQGIDVSAVPSDMASAVLMVGDLNMTDALFLMLAGSLSSIVPVPGGFGAFHFLVAGALSYTYGLPFGFGMIFATLSHESQAINQIIWGMVSYISEHFRKKQ